MCSNLISTLSTETNHGNKTTETKSQKQNAKLTISLRGGDQAYNFLKEVFETLFSGDGLDRYSPLEGGFVSMRAILPM